MIIIIQADGGQEITPGRDLSQVICSMENMFFTREIKVMYKKNEAILLIDDYAEGKGYQINKQASTLYYDMLAICKKKVVFNLMLKKELKNNRELIAEIFNKLAFPIYGDAILVTKKDVGKYLSHSVLYKKGKNNDQTVND